jgi:PIN domain nuclease of toxin-antitoxin system
VDRRVVRAVIHLDTHVVAWLFAKVDAERIPAGVRARLESEPLAVSPMVRLELGLLREIGRLADPPGRILDELARAIGLGVDGTSFADVVIAAESLSFTRDPFDRIIGAQAIVAGATLVTADRGLRQNLTVAVWD